ncbi:hypothetical protein GCM10027417_16650 [Glutamicibacter endophyticus]
MTRREARARREAEEAAKKKAGRTKAKEAKPAAPTAAPADSEQDPERAAKLKAAKVGTPQAAPAMPTVQAAASPEPQASPAPDTSKPVPQPAAAAAEPVGQQASSAKATPPATAEAAKQAPAPTSATEPTATDPAAKAADSEPAEPKASRAGRNLPAAIGVGGVLLAVVLAGLFWYPPLILGLVIVLAGLGCWEVARATTQAHTSVQLAPLLLASALLPLSASFGGLEAVGFGLLASLLVVVVFRLTEGLKGAAASIMASTFIIVWVPLLLSFAVLVLQQDNGQMLIATILLLVVANDTFGYIVGVLFGKHPMAPKVSPKKSWEGFAGSLVGAMIVGALTSQFWLDMPWWSGLILALVTVIAATTGDLSESTVKRDLGVKDMSHILPGHGGIMDRLDSVLFAVPVAYLVSHLLEWFITVP